MIVSRDIPARTAILGVGITGCSVARFFAANNMEFVFADTRIKPPLLSQAKQDYPDTTFILGEVDDHFYQAIDTIVVSPGVALDNPMLQIAKNRGIRLIGDTKLFFENTRAPVIAITGANGKSTVTSLVGEMAEKSGLRVGVGGNFGTPMLDLLDARNELYVLELSSFQLELVDDCRDAISALLNISPDHLDRYESYEHYQSAKQRIFSGAKHTVFNRLDHRTHPPHFSDCTATTFGLDLPERDNFGLSNYGEECWLVQGNKRLIRANELALMGRHNINNALAALALGYCIGMSMDCMLDTLRDFRGLPHRCEKVACIDGVLYIDDSKATNIGAVRAAISGFSRPTEKNILLIAGGRAKDNDFDDLIESVQDSVKHCLLIGEASGELFKTFGNLVPTQYMDTLENCVITAHGLAESGDVVLLSPACTSFDMFSDFTHRGRLFQEAVHNISQFGNSEHAL